MKAAFAIDVAILTANHATALAFSDPLFDFADILVNRTPPTRYSHNGDQHLGRHSRVGKGLPPPAGPVYEGGMSFARTVQPVLDRYCIRCHGLDKTEKGINLVYDRWRYPRSLKAIVSRGQQRIGDKRFSGRRYEEYPETSVNISRPRKFFAYENRVAQMLLKGDENHPSLAEEDRESYMRIIEWLDLNGQCFGDLFPNRIEQRRLDNEGLAALRAYAGELYGEAIARQPEHALVNVAQPSESRVLLMGLSVAAGGWGQFEIFQNKNDAGFRKMAQLVESAIIRPPDENTNGWEPTWAQGGGERWVIKARSNYLQRVDRQATYK